MRPALMLALLAALPLSACEKRKPPATPGAQNARYIGVGTYSPGRFWMRMTHAEPKNGADARISDDEQVIVVVDTRTGEVRQCGNLSGFCIAMNPWSRPAVHNAPAPMQQHAVRWPDVSLETEDAETAEPAPAPEPAAKAAP